jgi:predicted O-methyltransferase YrrM
MRKYSVSPIPSDSGDRLFRTTTLEKLRGLLAVAWRHPDEVTSRMRYHLIARPLQVFLPEPPIPDYAATPFVEVCAAVGGECAEEAMREDTLAELSAVLSLRMRQVGGKSTIGSHQNGGERLGQLCYLACRALRPSVVVETGVAHGVTSSYILAALHRNNEGILYSIDLPPLGDQAENFVGAFIPEKVRYRHRLVRGDARRRLPAVLRSVGQCSLFVHDSEHSYSHTTFELNTALQHLRRPGVILCDDASDSAAFNDFLISARPAVGAVAHRWKSGDGLIGVAVFR